ncbi:hypothetical protein FOZ61_003291 [Perkinsus olseni]|uniref:Uncharacterized protein n=1 Tax=Perkinsus olseni TaxID=32597 RepID=A0A7J6ME48_PEROL|nr:hypothetical protein FOZ61_003291 [Perkinsus olseni]KAF4674965.1 hypothetical protein FOL46_003411 [Perkinsus olseni]
MDRTYRATAEDLDVVDRFLRNVDVKYAAEPSVAERWHRAKELSEAVNLRAAELQTAAGIRVAPRTRLCETKTEVVVDGPAKITAEELDEDFVVPLLAELSTEAVVGMVCSEIYQDSLRSVSREVAAASSTKVRIGLNDLRPLPRANRESIQARMRSAGMLFRVNPWPSRPSTSSVTKRPCKWGDVPLYQCRSGGEKSGRARDLEERFKELVK